MPQRRRRPALLALFAALTFSLLSPARAQNNPPVTPPAQPPANPNSGQPAGVEPIRPPIRIGDTVTVLVIGEPTLSGQVQVDPDGNVTLPLAGQIKLNGLNPPDAGRLVTKVLKDKRLLRDPQVTVIISGRPMAVVQIAGQITTQGTRSIKEGTRLSEVLEPAGITPTSNTENVTITRDQKEIVVNYLQYKTGEKNNEEVNPTLRDGDKIFVYAIKTGISAGSFRVSGEVVGPNTFALTPTSTVGQALQQAGGVTPFADQNGIVIQRGASRIPVPYKDIRENKPGADIPLQPEDIVSIPRLEKPMQYTVAGAVNGGGQKPLQPGVKITLLEAIASAGGTSDGARQNEVEIRRAMSDGKFATTKYNLEQGDQASAEVQDGDYIFVPYPRRRPDTNIFSILGAVGSLIFLLGR